MSDSSLLQGLVNLATFVVAVNLAYLRFETFEHRARIKKYALDKLGKAADVPDNLKVSDYYKRLSFWAGISRDRKAVSGQLGWGWWHPYVFDTQRDRSASKFMIWSALPVVLVGTADAIWQIEVPDEVAWIGGTLLLALEVMTLGSVALVLGGNSYISRVCSQIDKDAEQWKIFMRDRTATARTEPVPHLPPPPGG